MTNIGSQAFYECDRLKSVTIPNSVTSIGSHAFFNCSYEATEFYMGSTVPTITSTTFFHCPSKIYVPFGTIEQFRAADVWKDLDTLYEMYVVIEGVKYSRTSANEAVVVGRDESIREIRILETITIDGKQYAVKKIAYAAFADNTTITSVVLPNTITTISEWAFVQCVRLTSITIPNSVTKIGDYAFAGCRGLTSLTIGNSVRTIGFAAFSACPGLTNVTIPNSVTSIGNAAFSDCSSLTSINIPNSVTSIGSSAFSGCSGLTSVTIPNSVKSIGKYAFHNCSGLTSITSCIEKPFAIDNSVFSNYNATLYVPIGTSEKYKSTDGWKDFKNIVEIEIDGIEGVTVSNSNSSNSENAPMYNLSGQRVGKNYKGIVIKNGKKMIVK